MSRELDCRVTDTSAGYLSEQEIRNALFQRFTYDPAGAVVLEEFPALGGRLDVLAICGKTLAGFEIKSDFDSLQRVEAQIGTFSQFCDRLTFVAGRRFALPLLRTLPIWCGVSLAYRTPPGNITLFTLRQAQVNPLVTATASASLLRRDELLLILERTRRTSARRRELQGELLSVRSFVEVRRLLSSALRLRERKRFDELQRLNGDLCRPEASWKGYPCYSSGPP